MCFFGIIRDTHMLKFELCSLNVRKKIMFIKLQSYSMVPENYMLTQQSDINEKMRGILIDWLIEVYLIFLFFQAPIF